MVKTVFSLFNKEISGLHEAAYLLGLFAFLSQVLALVRDRLLAGSFGAGELLDAYYAAFRIPDIIFVTVASLVSASIIIPLIVEKLQKSKEEAKKFVSSIFSAFSFLMAFVSVLIFILAPTIVPIIFPGFRGTNVEEMVVVMTRIMLLQPILLGISNFLAGIIQTYKKFFVYALAPLFYNAGIIIGVAYFYPLMGYRGLAWGVVLGALLHLLIQLPALYSTGLAPVLTLGIRLKEAYSVVVISLPRTLGLAANNLSTLVLAALGSLTGVGSIAIFTLSWNLQSVTYSIVGASYSMAAFPTLAHLFAGGKSKEFVEAVREAMGHIIFWSMPPVTLFIVLRAQIVRTVLGFGEFDWADTRLTAAALAIFAVSVVAQGAIALLSRAYYASGRTKKPLYSNVGGAILTILLAVFFVGLMKTSYTFQFFLESLLKVENLAGTAVLVLPLSYSIATLANMFVLWFLFRKDFPGWDKGLMLSIFQTAGAAILGGFAAYWALNIFDDVFNLSKVSGVFFQGLFSGLFGLLVNATILILLRNLAIREVYAAFCRKLGRVVPIGPDTTENPTL
ncbi:MAG: hypothetical protein A3H57_04985 [Candidatus Taylorbacteria bacterium RIFCSPLOWO2_02_FULL_43_11]|uniref:Lipid II flippase MurJ n=1 Tax=Candidatus Taylorbacteria bacterium RIFCSPHIGHO2_02_FULL_43_32b TaxID=1802306 RepID=A0A1G2MLL7_9BACT|nr:MAG: hypothetical protein A2743_02085 [Candidatus Taylorbacteria bacterium RIFCSPHIGHO2_01_FULL_43_47]OHA23902.1 MAG: hypothetical protein A3C72_01550 [Candidatus Taylorbacteria bacterium RIFCSPHIGHO2_02_FULL_43_32b]OHA30653.1 MAG: hypothetical protein A3B08_03795 [Candidatus Taylorbacteria bacterium RIFCSPLOWO2_01_FULL_43_44]OHA37368.1 MAG: hypothetical protein A3H57_04985 [Candidatus Taylorbacteria bacterium RIFCSPLOWO2_02_FULL_43_11]